MNKPVTVSEATRPHNKPSLAVGVANALLTQAGVDLREDGRDTVAEERQYPDDDDGDKHEEQGVLAKTLTVLTRENNDEAWICS